MYSTRSIELLILTISAHPSNANAGRKCCNFQP
jgi:hypothetical protein